MSAIQQMLCSIMPKMKAWAYSATLLYGFEHGGSTGTITDAVVGGGYLSPGITTVGKFDGTAWSTGVSLLRLVCNNVMAGSYSALINSNGYTTVAVKNTDVFNGTTWTVAADSTTNLYGAGCCGIPTAFLTALGGGSSGQSNKFNGTSWTALGAYPVSGYDTAMVGSLSDALTAGGALYNSPYATSFCGTFNGTAWAGHSYMPWNRANGCVLGTPTDAVYACGTSGTGGGVNTSAHWNGLAWALTPSASLGRYYGGFAGTSSGGQSTGIAIGGTGDAIKSSSEIYR